MISSQTLTTHSIQHSSQAVQKPLGQRAEFEKVRDALSPNVMPDSVTLDQIGQQLLSSTQPSMKDLLLYQMQVQRFGLRVELLSKVAESAVATARKLQSNQ